MHILTHFCILFLAFAMAMPLQARTTKKTTTPKEEGKFILIIDPGHGGNDTGAQRRNRSMDEKDITLAVALKFGKMVEKNCDDVKVIYTRKTDTTISLPARAKKAREEKGDLYISIHVNAAPDRSAYGIETYTFGISGDPSKKSREQQRIQDKWSIERENVDFDGKEANFLSEMSLETKVYLEAQRQKHSNYSKEAARYVQNALVAAFRGTSYHRHVNNRGVKSANLYVLCYSPMAAILIELGYISNPQEERFLNTESGLEACAKGIYSGFLRYRQDWKKRRLPSENDNRVEGLVQPEEFHKEAPAPQKETQAPQPPKGGVTNETDTPPSEGKKDAPAQPKKEAPQPPKGGVTNETDTPPSGGKKEAPQAPQAPKGGVTSESNTPPSGDKGAKSQIVYKIQYLSATKLYKEGDPALKGVTPVSYYKEGNVYRYTYGEASSPAGLSKDIRHIRTKFKDAFVAKFDSQGNRIR